MKSAETGSRQVPRFGFYRSNSDGCEVFTILAFAANSKRRVSRQKKWAALYSRAAHAHPPGGKNDAKLNLRAGT